MNTATETAVEVSIAEDMGIREVFKFNNLETRFVKCKFIELDRGDIFIMLDYGKYVMKERDYVFVALSTPYTLEGSSTFTIDAVSIDELAALVK